jgi:hypothetical protein
MSEQKSSHEVEGLVLKAQIQDCVEAQNISTTLKVPKNPVAIIILKLKFGTNTLPRADRPGQT